MLGRQSSTILPATFSGGSSVIGSSPGIACARMQVRIGTGMNTFTRTCVVATSAANDCHYCVIAHGAILRIRAKNPLIADQVAVNYRKADLSERQKAMLAFAMKVSRDAAAVDEGDLDALRALDFSDDDIWDIGAISAFFAQSNRLANLAAIRPNDEFYSMAR